MPPSSFRASLLVATALAAPVGAWRLAGPWLRGLAEPLRADGPDALDALGLPSVLTGVCAVLLLAGVAWLSGTTLLLTALRVGTARLPGSRALACATRGAERLSPAVARGLVVAALGLGPGAALTGPALADPVAAPGHPPAGAAQVLDGLPMPDRAVGGAATATATAARDRVVVVHRGDSLWSVAAELLPSGARAAAVARTSAALFAANADRLGPDPDLIHPGDRLTVPPDSHHREEHR